MERPKAILSLPPNKLELEIHEEGDKKTGLVLLVERTT